MDWTEDFEKLCRDLEAGHKVKITCPCGRTISAPLSVTRYRCQCGAEYSVNAIGDVSKDNG